MVGQPVAVAQAHRPQLWVQRAMARGENRVECRGEPLVIHRPPEHLPTGRCRQAIHEGCAAVGSQLCVVVGASRAAVG